jgi:hypothetical protein
LTCPISTHHHTILCSRCLTIYSSASPLHTPETRPPSADGCLLCTLCIVCQSCLWRSKSRLLLWNTTVEALYLLYQSLLDPPTHTHTHTHIFSLDRGATCPRPGSRTPAHLRPATLPNGPLSHISSHHSPLLSFSLSLSYTMADEAKEDGKVRKQEEDYTKEVDDALPKAVAQATVRRPSLPLVQRGGVGVLPFRPMHASMPVCEHPASCPSPC